VAVGSGSGQDFLNVGLGGCTSGWAHSLTCVARSVVAAGELINVLKEAKQKVPEVLLSFGTTVKKKEHSLYGAHFKNIDLSKKATKITFD